jgi:hypothetical protein
MDEIIRRSRRSAFERTKRKEKNFVKLGQLPSFRYYLCAFKTNCSVIFDWVIAVSECLDKRDLPYIRHINPCAFDKQKVIVLLSK